MISIVIPAFNQLAYCRQCVQSILLNTQRPYRLVLVDNASSDGVGAFFDSVPGARVVHAPENRGFAGGVNLGIAEAEGHVLLLNSDTLVPHGWLGRLEDALLRSDDIGIVGPYSNCVSGRQQIEGLEFDDTAAIDAYADERAQKHAGKLAEVARLVGFCMLIRDRVIAEVGVFDEQYGLGNYEDDDYCLRTLRAGYRLCLAEDAFVFHYGSRTFMGMDLVDDAWHALMDTNRRYFEEKWAATAAERSDAAQASRQLNREAKAALKLGEATVAVKRYLEAIQVAPFYEQNYNDLAVALWEMGEPEHALDNVKRALLLNPSQPDALDNLRQIAKVLGRAAEAETFLRELRERKEQSGEL